MAPLGLRREEGNEKRPDLTPGDAGRLEVRPADHAALVDGRPLSLTLTELQLLIALAHHPERVMARTGIGYRFSPDG